jgi:hypothetical protein
MAAAASCVMAMDRAIQTGVGPVEVRRAKGRDRGDVGAEEKIGFTSSICRNGRSGGRSASMRFASSAWGVRATAEGKKDLVGFLTAVRESVADRA